MTSWWNAYWAGFWDGWLSSAAPEIWFWLHASAGSLDGGFADTLADWPTV